MPQTVCHSNTLGLRTVYAGRDLLQLVSKHNAVLLDATAPHYDTRGWLMTEHVGVDLPISGRPAELCSTRSRCGDVLKEGSQHRSRDLRLAAKSRAHDRSPLRTNLALPAYVRERLDAYIEAHPGTTFRSVIMEGLAELGIEIDEDDMTPERARRRARATSDWARLDPSDITTTSLVLPRYVRARAEAYLLDHPDMRFRHLVLAGLAALGIKIHAEDMVAERQNVSGLIVKPGRGGG